MKIIKIAYNQKGSGIGPEGLVYGNPDTGKRVSIPLNRIKTLFDAYISVSGKMTTEEFMGLQWIGSVWDDPEIGPELKQFLSVEQPQAPTDNVNLDLAQQMDQAAAAGDWNTVKQLKNQIKGI